MQKLSDLNAIRVHWQGARWLCEIEHEGEYATNAVLYDNFDRVRLDLGEPTPDEIYLVQQIADATHDIQALLTEIDRLRDLLWTAPDSVGSRYCRLCERKAPNHEEWCAINGTNGRRSNGYLETRSHRV